MICKHWTIVHYPALPGIHGLNILTEDRLRRWILTWIYKRKNLVVSSFLSNYQPMWFDCWLLQVHMKYNNHPFYLRYHANHRFFRNYKEREDKTAHNVFFVYSWLIWFRMCSKTKKNMLRKMKDNIRFAWIIFLTHRKLPKPNKIQTLSSSKNCY